MTPASLDLVSTVPLIGEIDCNIQFNIIYIIYLNFSSCYLDEASINCTLDLHQSRQLASMRGGILFWDEAGKCSSALLTTCYSDKLK